MSPKDDNASMPLANTSSRRGWGGRRRDGGMEGKRVRVAEEKYREWIRGTVRVRRGGCRTADETDARRHASLKTSRRHKAELTILMRLV